jgi:predicted O-linked N-acetylglucosamine transferase (SPINDLY family)
MSAAQTFDVATERHRQGQLREAERLYQQVLGEDPHHTNAMFLLSVLSMGAGKLDDASYLLQKAIELSPNNPAFHSNLGEIQRRLGKNKEAVQSLLTALSLKPDLAEPAFNLGLALRALGETEMALISFERAADIKYDVFAVQYAFATALRVGGQLERAVGHYQCALALQPKSVEALVDLANVLQALGRLDGATHLLKRAIDISPNFALAHNNLGSVHLDKLQFDEAIACFRRALTIDPGFAAAHNNLANAMKDCGDIEEAVAGFRRAVAADPSDHQVHSNLVYTLSFLPGHDALGILQEARAWCSRHTDRLSSEHRPHDNERSPQRRLRIGYVSPDFRDHCQSFFMHPLLRHHDHENFEIVCYASVQKPDAVTEQLRIHADRFCDITQLDDAAAAERIRQDGIDILVDLTMHMAHGRLPVFARKPAPVQISWLAYPGTTGLDAIDYRVTDPFLDPAELEREGEYAECSLRLPETFWCYDPLGGPEVNPLPAASAGHVTFGCLNNYCKVNNEVLDLWARVVRAVPNSKLFLLSPHGDPRRDAQRAFERAGLEPDRLLFVGRRSRLAYLSHYHRIDVCLDTFPYNGHTTSLDAMWMGVPVVTLVGKTVVGRAGLCQAMNLGLPELVATNADQYVERAIDIVRDRERLSVLRATLRGRMEKSPLMDAPRFARHLEAAYRDVWQRYCGVSGAGM